MMTSGHPWRRHAQYALPAAVALCLAVAAAPAAAQVVISSQSRGSVVVNGDALDALGPAPLPQLVDPNLSLRRFGAPAPAIGPGGVPRSRVYALPPNRPGAAPASAMAAAPAAPIPMAAAPAAPQPTSRLASGMAPSPAAAPPPVPSSPPMAAPVEAPPPARVARAEPPPAPPPERLPPRQPMTASAPPPPSLDTPAPPRAPRPTPPAASAPPPAPTPAPPLVAAAPPMSAPAAPAPSTQLAAAAGTLSRVIFAPGSADLTDGTRRELSELAQKLGRDGDSRIQLLAYAEGTPESESQARRLSLSRALAVRSYLIEQGVRSTRVNVQALGIKSPGGPADRVDAMAVAP